MRKAIVSLLLLVSFFSSAVNASPDGEVAAALASRSSWTNHTSKGSISFSSPPGWVYQDDATQGRALLTVPAGSLTDQDVTMVIAVTRLGGRTLESIVEATRATLLEGYQPYTNPPALQWQAWRTAPAGKVFEYAVSHDLAPDCPRYLTIQRLLKVGDHEVHLVLGLPEPVSPQQLQLARAVLDSFQSSTSIYDQLKL